MLIFVDCEATGTCPANGKLTEIGAVAYPSKKTFYCKIYNTHPSLENPAIPVIDSLAIDFPEKAFVLFKAWLDEISINERFTLVSDNPAYDWQWINDGFWKTLLAGNPFGYSARRIGDVWAGITGNINDTSSWKKFRKTKHTHNPLDDAMGNVEAWERMMEIMERNTK